MTAVVHRPPPRPVRADGPAPPLRSAAQVEVLADPDAVSAVADEWLDLAAAAGASPFQEPVYALTWWRHRGRGRLHVVTVRSGGALVALAPLHVRPIAGLQVVRFLGHGLGTVSEVLVRPGQEAAAAAVWEHLAGLPRVLVELLEYRGDGGGLAQLRRSDALRSTAALRDVCPVIDLAGVSCGDDLLERLHRRHRLRRAVRRSERFAVEEGVTTTVDVVRDAAGIEALLPAVEAVYDAAEERQPRLHLLRPPWRDFLLELLRAWAARGQVTLLVARVDGVPAAFEVTVEDPVTSSSWLTRFDPAAAAYSPGHLLTRRVVDEALARGAARNDLLIGDGAHKLPWATGSYDTLTVHAAPSALGPRRAALDAALAARAAAARVRGAGR